MADQYNPNHPGPGFAAAARIASHETMVARPPFAVSESLRAFDEQLEQMVLRTGNVLERLRGSTPADAQAVKAGHGFIENTAEAVQDKLRALSNNISQIDQLI